MTELASAASPTTEGEAAVSRIADRHGFSMEATRLMHTAVSNGHGAMAQFDHPEFGGFGQWMRGGMTMLSSMNDHGLKARVDALCCDLAALDATPSTARDTAASGWWPDGLGMPDSTGGQNDVRYAYFRSANRLVVDDRGRMTQYDTRGFDIGGVAQQQGSASTLTFSSTQGTVDLARLPRVA